MTSGRFLSVEDVATAKVGRVVYLTAKDIAEELQISLRTAYSYARQMLCIAGGRTGVVERKDFDAWVVAHTRPPVRFGTVVRKDLGAGVYFLQGGDDGAIKIGMSRDITRRVSELQKCSPVELRIIGTIERMVGAAVLEASFHKRLAEHRLHGEWFKNCDEVRLVIARATHLDEMPAE